MLETPLKALRISPLLSLNVICNLQITKIFSRGTNQDKFFVLIFFLKAVIDLLDITVNYADYLVIKDYLKEHGYHPLMADPFFNELTSRQQLKIATHELQLGDFYKSHRDSLSFFKRYYLDHSLKVNLKNFSSALFLPTFAFFLTCMEPNRKPKEPSRSAKSDAVLKWDRVILRDDSFIL